MITRVTKVSVSLVLALCDRTRRLALQTIGRSPSAVFVVIYYHAVRSEERPSFGQQLDHLVKSSTTVRADHDGPFEPGRRYSAVTFDDGFISVVENALPELRLRNLPCTLFIPTGCLGAKASWIRAGQPDSSETVAPASMIRVLARDELVEIGSHSVTHPHFNRLDDETARQEFERLKADLEAIIDRDVRTFSFPHGACNLRSIDLAKHSGYGKVFTIEPTLASIDGAAFVLGRVRVEPSDWPIEFRLKARGSYRWMPRVSAWKRRTQAYLRRRGRSSVTDSVHGVDQCL